MMQRRHTNSSKHVLFTLPSPQPRSLPYPRPDPKPAPLDRVAYAARSRYQSSLVYAERASTWPIPRSPCRLHILYGGHQRSVMSSAPPGHHLYSHYPPLRERLRRRPAQPVHCFGVRISRFAAGAFASFTGQGDSTGIMI